MQNPQYYQQSQSNWLYISPTCRIETSKPLGKGGFGVVYKGQISNNNFNTFIDVAVKELRKFMDRMNVNEYFEKEVEICKQIKAIQCHNIVQIIDIFPSQQEPNMYYVAMDLCCKDLSTYKKELGGKLETLLALKIIRDIAQGIKALHDLNIAHRDIKPDNIFLKDQLGSYIFKVGDFGLGKDQNLLESKVGTICYMAPDMLKFEQLQYTLKVDVWALGVMTHELLTGVILFNGQSPDIIRNIILRFSSYKQQYQDSLKRSNYNNDLITNSFLQIETEFIVDLIDQMLEKDASKRKNIAQIIISIEETITKYEDWLKQKNPVQPSPYYQQPPNQKIQIQNSTQNNNNNNNNIQNQNEFQQRFLQLQEELDKNKKMVEQKNLTLKKYQVQQEQNELEMQKILAENQKLKQDLADQNKQKEFEQQNQILNQNYQKLEEKYQNLLRENENYKRQMKTEKQIQLLQQSQLTLKELKEKFKTTDTNFGFQRQEK